MSPKDLINIKHADLEIFGPTICNVPLVDIRNMPGCIVNSFKHGIDEYLATVADEPWIWGYAAMRRDELNSLLRMAQSEAIQ